MKQHRLLTLCRRLLWGSLLPLLLLVACGNDESSGSQPGWVRYTSETLNATVEHPEEWDRSDNADGLILGTNTNVINALESETTIAGGAIFISSLPLEAVFNAEPIEILTTLLNEYGAFEDRAWVIQGAPYDLEFNSALGVGATLENQDDTTRLDIAVVNTETEVVIMLLIDTTLDQQHITTLGQVASTFTPLDGE